MKYFEIAVNENVNSQKLTNILSNLTAIGCKISTKNSNLFVEYSDELEDQVKEVFDINSDL